MRLKATIPNHPQLDTAIIYEKSPYSYYVYVISDDHRHGFDTWFGDIESAKYHCESQYGVSPGTWEEIPDVLPGALPQFEVPTVGIRDETGKMTFISYAEAQEREIVPPKPQQIQIVEDPELIANVRVLSLIDKYT
ncbi:MAG: hypothetical protein AAFR22_14995, partial [Chloroflexota bacterium]